MTCDQNHGYSAEQSAFDGGLMDKFVQDTQGTGCTETTYPDSSSYGPNGIVMDYFDGNTVTALWNYAQHFTLNDNSYSTQFGPSTPGAINVVSGQTHGAVAEGGTTSAIANGTDESDVDPAYDLCSNPSSAATRDAAGQPVVSGDTVPMANGVTMAMTGPNIGNLLNTKNITWGWFQGGFTPTGKTANGPRSATRSRTPTSGARRRPTTSSTTSRSSTTPSTSNPFHDSAELGGRGRRAIRPTRRCRRRSTTSTTSPGSTRRSTTATCRPSSYLKAPAYEDGHAGYSDPLDEQRFLVDEINGSRSRRSGPRRRSSSPTTTPTAGTTTRWARSSVSRRTHWTR